jgi:hypothetical protein
MDLYVLCSILAVDILIVLFALFLGLLRIQSAYIIRANILSMLLIMLLSHVDIHICYH